MQPPELERLFQKFAAVSTALSTTEKRQAATLAVALDASQRDVWQRTIEAHEAEPLLQVYLSDGWGRLLGKTTKRTLG